jgi:hypothetical protein
MRIAAGIAPAVLLLVVSLWEAWAARVDAIDVPGELEWTAAEKLVRAGYRPGDLIVFAPDWIDPIGRMHLGDLMAVRDVARMDAAKYARIWEVSIRGARAPETAGLHVVGDSDRVKVFPTGIHVRSYEQTPVHVLADVRDLLATAKIDGGGAPHRELAEVGFAPHDCIEVTPASKQPVRITFPGVKLGEKLVGYVGLADVFTRRDIRAPGKLEVQLAGRPLASATPGVDDGWVRFEAATSPGTGELTFVISADAPSRLVCFAAETRE